MNSLPLAFEEYSIEKERETLKPTLRSLVKPHQMKAINKRFDELYAKLKTNPNDQGSSFRFCESIISWTLSALNEIYPEALEQEPLKNIQQLNSYRQGFTEEEWFEKWRWDLQSLLRSYVNKLISVKPHLRALRKVLDNEVCWQGMLIILIELGKYHRFLVFDEESQNYKLNFKIRRGSGVYVNDLAIKSLESGQLGLTDASLIS